MSWPSARRPGRFHARRKVKKLIISHKISIKVTLFSRTNYAFFGVDEPAAKGDAPSQYLAPTPSLSIRKAIIQGLQRLTAPRHGNAQGRTRFTLSCALRACPGLCRVGQRVGHGNQGINHVAHSPNISVCAHTSPVAQTFFLCYTVLKTYVRWSHESGTSP